MLKRIVRVLSGLSLAAMLTVALASTLAAQPPGRFGGGRMRGQGQSLASQPQARDDGEKRVLATLEGIVNNHQTYLSVPMQDGMALRLMAEASGAKDVVEVGTSTGYSGLCR